MRAIVLAVCLVALAGEARAVSRVKLCRQQCGAVIAECVAHGGPKHGCAMHIRKRCRKHGIGVCATTTTTTTLAGGGSPGGGDAGTTTTTVPFGRTTTTTRVTATSTTTSTIPTGATFRGVYDFGGNLVTDTCGVSGIAATVFATMNVENGFGSVISGYIRDADFTFFDAPATGATSWPVWSMTTGICAVTTFGGRCGRVQGTMTGFPGTFTGGAPGTLEFLWDGPACTVRWQGEWN